MSRPVKRPSVWINKNLFLSNHYFHKNKYEYCCLALCSAQPCINPIHTDIGIVKILNLYIILLYTHLYHSSFQDLSVTYNAFILFYHRNKWFQPANGVRSTRLLVEIHNKFISSLSWCSYQNFIFGVFSKPGFYLICQSCIKKYFFSAFLSQTNLQASEKILLKNGKNSFMFWFLYKPLSQLKIKQKTSSWHILVDENWKTLQLCAKKMYFSTNFHINSRFNAMPDKKLYI